MSEKMFGAYKLPAWAQGLASFCQKLPVNYLGKRLAFLLRKPVLAIARSPVDIEVNGARFRLFPGANLSDKRLLCTPGLLEGAEREFLQKVLKPDSWLIDVGANIGGYCLLVAAARQDLRVVAIEADPELVERLQQNIGFSGFEKRVHVLWAAATETKCTVLLNRDEVNRGKNTIVGRGDDTTLPDNSPEIARMPLLEVMEQYAIERADAVKLDIEGHELPVLQGFFETAPRDRWPLYIQMEQHRNEELNAAVRLTMNNGYRLLERTRMNVILSMD